MTLVYFRSPKTFNCDFRRNTIIFLTIIIFTLIQSRLEETYSKERERERVRRLVKLSSWFAAKS